MLVKKSDSQFYPSIFDVIFNNEGFENNFNFSKPLYNVGENSNDFIIEIAAPGFEKENFKIEINNDLLEIISEKELKDEKKENKYFYKGFSYENFKRSFSLPENVDKEKISANYENGILKVIIPKDEKKKISKQIQIS
ncbi:MAG: Hsp20/alpha crystallin family protein [Bacteroidales bacterium]|jgi:HSP20 family protein|nr:Hsp20/alpha crystallin family protein [Bacteroidales bacterium]